MAKRVRKTSQQPQSGNRAARKRAERALKSRCYDDIGVTRGVAVPGTGYKPASSKTS